MLTALDEIISRWCAAWVDGVQRRAVLVVVLLAALTACAGAYTLARLGLNTNEDAMFSEDVPYVALRREWNRAFPTLVDPIVIVVDAPTRDRADIATQRLAERLREDREHFLRIYEPNGGPFFERYGLLYLSTEELESLVDQLIEMQGYLAELSRDPTLRGFVGALSQAADAVADGHIEGLDLADFFRRLEQAVVASAEGRQHVISWSDVVLGEATTRKERRRFLMVQGRVDYAQMTPAQHTLLALRQIVSELGYDDSQGIRIRSTGVFPLAYDEMERVSRQSTLAGVASFVLVAIVLLSGLRSPRLIAASLVTLLVGLVLTAGFAALAVGYLNLVSITFGVLFIGLSIDFAIHLCIRYAEFLQQGRASREAMNAAAGDVGGALVICAVTTAIGFYAFVPTEYRGVAQLGLIAGTGMFISLFTNLTLLPALTALGLRPAEPKRAMAWRLPTASGALLRHAGGVLGVAGGLALLALATLPRIQFDANPLRVRDPNTESVQVFNEMLEDGMAFPWNLNVLAPSLEEAEAVAARLEALPSVKYAVTLSDFVPEDQNERLEILAEAAFLIIPSLRTEPDGEPPTVAQQIEALRRLAASLGRMAESDLQPELRDATRALRSAIARFVSGLEQSPQTAPEAVARLEEGLVGSLPERLRVLRSALSAGSIELADLPNGLVEQMIGVEGQVRVEIFPVGDLNDSADLEAYVSEVYAVAPDAFGEGYVILESGRAVGRALRQALLAASIGIGLILLLLWRSVVDALLVALPLGLAGLFTAASTVLLETPFNFANVIVIPLLMGMGVDTGIHLVHRDRIAPTPERDLLQTSTARAVLFSSLTTMASFGTLGFSTHSGMASLGQLLTLGIGLILLCNLVVLPALVTVVRRWQGRNRGAHR